MKKIILIIVSIILSTPLFAQKFTVINGIAIGVASGNEIALRVLKNGVLEDYSRTFVSKEGGFGFSLMHEEECFITINYLQRSFDFYVKPGDQLNVELNFEKMIFELFGKNSKENIAISNWYDYFGSIILKSKFFAIPPSSTYEDFFPLYVEKCKGIATMSKKLVTGNSKFDSIMKLMVETDAEYYGILFINTPRSKHPKKEDMPAIYGEIKLKERLSDNNLLLLPNGSRKIGLYCQYGCKMNNVPFEKITEVSLAMIGTDQIKAEYLLTNYRIKSYAAFEEFASLYGNYFTKEPFKKRFDDLLALHSDFKVGDKAPDFTYPDASGKMVSLSDFKGKVVLVDVWATWCGPCMKEVPHLLRLEKELHDNKDIVFMGISLDEEKDKGKWIATLKEKGLNDGIQLFASGWSKITKDYKIKGIPRFILFDKKGNIHALEAPRPSSPALKTMLLKLAAQ